MIEVHSKHTTNHLLCRHYETLYSRSLTEVESVDDGFLVTLDDMTLTVVMMDVLGKIFLLTEHFLMMDERLRG
jgi:hypothetical protein